jgi:hypothetical protein
LRVRVSERVGNSRPTPTPQGLPLQAISSDNLLLERRNTTAPFSRIGGKAGIGGEQSQLTLLTASRAARLSAPPPYPLRNCWEVKFKISRLRLEMTVVSPALQGRPVQAPTPHWGEGRPISLSAVPYDNLSFGNLTQPPPFSRIGGKAGIGGEQDKLAL